MYRALLVLTLLALSVAPSLARGVAGHATMHRLGSNLRHHHVDQPTRAIDAVPGQSNFKAN